MSSTPPREDPVEYLIWRRFHAQPSGEDSAADGYPPADPEGGCCYEGSSEIAAFRSELQSKSPAELAALVDEELAKEQRELLARSRRENESTSFEFPDARADFAHWGKAAYWTLEEGVALAVGAEPEAVSWDRVQSLVPRSSLAKAYARTRQLVMRASELQQLSNPIRPVGFLAWARQIGLQLPEGLIAAVESSVTPRGAWRSPDDLLREQYEAVVHERDTLLALCRQAINQRDFQTARLDALRDKAAGWQFDEHARDYPEELDVAMQAWWAVRRNRDPGVTVKQQIQGWVDEHYPRLTDEAKLRIATVCNWEKRGGRPIRKE